MSGTINHLHTEHVVMEPMDFLELLPSKQAERLRDVLEAEDMSDAEKEHVALTVIKNKFALDAFTTWWKKKQAGNVENFLCDLKPSVRRMAELHLNEENIMDLEKLMERDPTAHRAFLAWKAIKYQENLVTEEDFLALLNSTLRRFAEEALGKNDMEGLTDLMETPRAISAKPLFEKWMAQKKPITVKKAASLTSSVSEKSQAHPVQKLERQLRSTAISSVHSEPELGLEYSSWSDVPNNSGGHLVGKEGKTRMDIERKAGCKVDVERGDNVRSTRYRVGGINQQAVEKGLHEVIVHLAKIQKTEEMVHPALINGLQSLPESALIEFQRKFRVCLSKNENSLGTASITMKAWDHLGLSAAKNELRRMVSTPAPQCTSAEPLTCLTLSTTSIQTTNDDQISLQAKLLQKILINSNTDENTSTNQPKVNAKPEENNVDSRSRNTANNSNHPKLQGSIPQPTLKTDKFPKNMNLLILGETGVGKSTFINGLVNYLKYGSIEDAMDGGVEILIRSHFRLTDSEYRSREIISEPTIAEERTSAVNENSKTGASATQDPKSYVFSYGPNDEKTIRIIDTPGIGDTRGVTQDKKNFSKILNFISDFCEIHAVCILIKPNTARLTISFRFCIDELLVHLHRSASQNIIFCFTNTRGTLYKPGDTLPTLREHLDNLADHRNIRISLDKSTLFSFDSESFRFLCAYQNKFQFSETEKRDFASSWRHSVDETLRMFERVSQLPAHSVQDTLSLNNTRNLILSLTRPLGEIAKTQMLNMQLIADKRTEIEENSAAGKDMLSKLHVDKIVVNSIPLNKPQTVCTAKSCVEYHSMQAETNVLQTIYKTVCHADCQLQGVQAEVVPNPELQKCAAMSGTGSPCSHCGCRWETHMHIMYRLETSVEKGTDPEVQKSIDRKDSAKKTMQIFLDNTNQELRTHFFLKSLEELKAEHHFITDCCAEFAAFLSEHSIIPYNDSYGQYIDHLIKEETEKINSGGGTRLLEELQLMKLEYQSQVEMLKSSINRKAREVKTIQEVDGMIKQLSKLKHCGKTIEEIKNIRIHTIRKNAADPSSKIHVSGGMFGGIKKAVKRLIR